MSERGKVWLKEFKTLALLMVVVVFLRSSVFSFYVIPTGSMLPTIKIDDRVFANKLAYGLMLPFSESQIVSWDEPKRGDIVLFKSPTSEDTFVKRVAGIGGDHITFKNGVLNINDKPMVETEQSDRTVMDDMGEPGTDKTLYLEAGLSEQPHYVLRSTIGGPTAFETREFVVPEGKIFCLGDNRDGSNDSRYWGYVDVKRVYGRAVFVFFSTMRSENFLPQFRTNRFFKSLGS